MKRKTMITLALLSALCASTASWAVDYPLPPANSRLIGQNQYWTVQRRSQPAGDCAPFRYRGDADPRSQRYDCAGAAEARHSSPYPSQMLLPDVPREGIVVNLAELRLYYFRRERIRCRSIRWALAS